jgi:hypothetical protein
MAALPRLEVPTPTCNIRQQHRRHNEDRMIKPLTESQRTYEAKRAAKAGMSLDKWLARKEKDRVTEARAKVEAAKPAEPPKKPGFFGRLMERAQKPI